MTGPAAGKASLGRTGEDAAACELQRLGYRILERNWRCRLGEIDIVASLGDTLVFVEVKSRTSSAFGAGAEAVDCRKQVRLRRLAEVYLSVHPSKSGDRPLRFDVVSVDMRDPASPLVEVIEDAFRF